MLFIAEIGLNHNGNFDLACELIKQAKLSGADIAKMQLGWRSKDGELNHITKETLDQLFSWSKFVGIELAFSVFDWESFYLLEPYEVSRYKVASRTLKEQPNLVQHIVHTGKETIISLGMWNCGSCVPFALSNVKYLWCKSLYPAYPWQLSDMPKNFSNSIYSGYSDHTIGIECALLAVSRGAQIIEKHFTLDKSDRTIRDHVLSATPDEFKNLVNIGRTMAEFISRGV